MTAPPLRALTTDRARDLAARALGAGAFLLAFAPWEWDEFSAVNGGRRGLVLLVRSARSVRAAGFTSPLDALTGRADPWDAMNAAVVLAWLAYLGASLAAAVAPRARVRVRFVLAAVAAEAVATLGVLEAVFGVVLRPGVVRGASLESLAAFVPALFLAAVVAAGRSEAHWARAARLAAPVLPLAATAAYLDSDARLHPWGALLVGPVVAAGLVLAQVNLRAAARASEDARTCAR
jgi:hypothetical protein